MTSDLLPFSVSPLDSPTSDTVNPPVENPIPTTIEVDISTNPVTTVGHQLLKGWLFPNPNRAIEIKIRYDLTKGIKTEWKTTYVNPTLYVEVPQQGHLSNQSKDAFMALLEYAEEVLLCARVVIYFSSEKMEGELLYRTFLFLGFQRIDSDSVFCRLFDPHNVYMAYLI